MSNEAQPIAKAYRRGRWTTWIVILALLAVTVAAFHGVAGCEFASYDDPASVTHHPMVNQGLRGAAIQWAFTAAHSSNWQPLTSLSHMMDVSLFGLHAGAHHMMSLAIHLLNALLVFFVWRRIASSLWTAAMIAALFAVHPLHAESVAWISQRKDLLSTLFWLLALTFHMANARSPSGWRYAALIVCSALALLAKPMAVTLPLTLLLLDWWPLHRMPQVSWSRLLFEKTPVFALCMTHAVVTIFAQRADGALDFNSQIPWSLRLGNVVVSCVGYICKLFWPRYLSPFYPYPESIPVGLVMGAVAFVAGVSWLVWRLRLVRPWLLFGWLWYLITLLPVCGLVQTGAHAMADRYTYVPLLGLFSLLVCEMGQWRSDGRARRVVVEAVVCIALVACAWTSARQVSVWRTPDSVLERISLVAGEHPTLFRERALLLQLKGRPQEEVDAEHRRGLARFPGYAFFLLELSLAEARAGRFAEARALIDRARVVVPENPGWCVNLGSIAMMEGKTDEAVEVLRRCLKKHPAIGSAHGLIGRIRMSQGRFVEAAEEFRVAIKCDRWDWLSHNELGIALFQAGMRQEALAEFRHAHWINPADPGVAGNLEQLQGTPVRTN